MTTITGSVLNDLLVAKFTSANWINLTNLVDGSWPAPRKSHGFAVADGKLYVHGGRGKNGISCNFGQYAPESERMPIAVFDSNNIYSCLLAMSYLL